MSMFKIEDNQLQLCELPIINQESSQENSENIIKLLTKNFTKFTELIQYLRAVFDNQ